MDWPVNSEAALDSIRNVFDYGSWWHYHGPTLRDFETRFANAHDCSYGVGICNGTMAFDTLLRGLGIGSGDKVILPAYDFFSLPKSVSNVGAAPVFVDVHPNNPTINADLIGEALTDDVKAVVAVHIDGCTAQLDKLHDICKDAGVHLIEDCAQASGARYAGKRVGSWGTAGIFSFGGVKLMTCGQGGMITTSDRDLYERCFAIVNRGFLPDGKLNPQRVVGDNYGMLEMAAAALVPQLEALDSLCEQRLAMISELDKAVSKLDGFYTYDKFSQQEIGAQMRYSFRFDKTKLDSTQSELIRKAREQGIPLLPGYQCVLTAPQLFGQYSDAGCYPNASAIEESALSIMHIDLWTKGVEFWRDALQRLPEPVIIVG